MLLPPDLRQWVADDDMVHFVIEAVSCMKLPSLKVNRRGTGSRQYPPGTMLMLLIYCYAHGIFSSRRIERATYRDVAVRYLMADTHPDHDTIAKFRRENFDAVAEAFVAVLQLAKQMGVLRVGTVSVDGTHISASASKDRNVRYDRAKQLDEQLRQDVEQLLQRAEQTDADEQSDDGDGHTLPERIARREKLRARMQQAQRELERQAKARAEAEREAYERKLAERQERKTQGKTVKGCDPRPPRDTPEDKDQVNLTDADSRLMRKSRRSSYKQAYNAQAAVDADGSMLILANHVTNSASDAHQLIPAIEGVEALSLGPVNTILADTGYAHSDSIDQLQEQGKDVYVPPTRGENDGRRRYDYRPPPKESKPPRTLKNPTLVAMREKLGTDAGRAKYRQRQQTVEPVFGIIKNVLGFERFSLRGEQKVSGEWSLISLAYNVKRLWKLQAAL